MEDDAMIAELEKELARKQILIDQQDKRNRIADLRKRIEQLDL